MIIDMHMHEMRYSGDSFLRLENMVEIAKRRGLDGICITDHDSMGLTEYAKEYSREHQYPVLVGAEFFSLWGDITAFGIGFRIYNRIISGRILCDARDHGTFRQSQF